MSSIGKYTAIAKTNFVNSTTYFMDFFSGSLLIGLIIFIFINLWQAVYSSGPGIIEGFTIAMVLWYFVMTESIVTSHSRVLEDIGEDVISGELANYLNKPYSYMLYRYYSSIGKAILKFSLTFIIGGIIVFFMLGGLKVEAYQLPFIALIVLLAISLHFLIMALLGLFAFWLEDARSLNFIYSKIVFTIGGMLIPLEFFPAWLASISAYLPFSYIAYYPAKLFVDFSFGSFIKVLGAELLWITLFTLLIAALYNKLARRLSVNGG